MSAKQPPGTGERVIVHGILYAQAIVERVELDEKTRSWIIHLDWGEHGKSRVYSHDEGLIWHRYAELN